MVRWRWCVLFLVLLVPYRLTAKMNKRMDKGDKNEENADDNDDHGDDNDSNDDDDYDEEEDDDEDGGGRSKLERTSLTLKRTSASFDFSTGASSTTSIQRTGAPSLARTTKKKPLECYVCAFKKGIALQACLDPWKHRVHTVVCQSLTDRCYTWIVSKESKYEAVTRGCKAGCVSSPETICCEFNRCNNQAITLPGVAPQLMPNEVDKKTGSNLAKRPIPPGIMLFVTVLLLLQTVVKVPIT